MLIIVSLFIAIVRIMYANYSIIMYILAKWHAIAKL